MLGVIADTSVVFGWFHEKDEQEVEASRALLRLSGERRIALSVLDLTRFEIGNAMLRGRARATAARTIAVLDSLGVTCPATATRTTELRQATLLAEQHQLTFHDAVYAAVAQSRDAELASLDQALLRAGLGRRPSEIVAIVEA